MVEILEECNHVVLRRMRTIVVRLLLFRKSSAARSTRLLSKDPIMTIENRRNLVLNCGCWSRCVAGNLGLSPPPCWQGKPNTCLGIPACRDVVFCEAFSPYLRSIANLQELFLLIPQILNRKNSSWLLVVVVPVLPSLQYYHRNQSNPTAATPRQPRTIQ